LSFTDRNKKKTEEVFQLLKENGIRADIDLKDSTVNDKVRNAELAKIPYTILIGDKEEQNNTLALRCKGKKPEFGININDFISRIKEEISERK
jgi:threonyl-tRNA synthetase